MKKEATIHSEHASKYLTVLCRHFSRKVESVWDECRGHVIFPMGEAQFYADQSRQTLRIECEADDEVKLKHVLAIIDGHVHLFSRREPLQLDWVVMAV